MVYTLPPFGATRRPPFDSIIDVRSPAEFAEDHIPGAINLPALSDAERAEVGTVYVQKSRFQARKLGAAMVARNVAHHIETALMNNTGDWKPMVYCWRGGQRSGSFAMILNQIGWRAETLEGGYRAYRRMVKKYLYDRRLPHRFILLDGYTGTAKTEILNRLGALGHQVLDLEGLACHSESLFGALSRPQPTQKTFESQLAAALSGFKPQRPVLVEAESSKIGARSLPPVLWQAMCAAPRLVIDAPLSARALYTLRTYHEIAEDTGRLRAQVDELRPFQPADRIAHWHDLIEKSDLLALIEDLMQHHYDPRYRKSRIAHSAGSGQFEGLRIPSLDSAALARAAEAVGERLEATIKG